MEEWKEYKIGDIAKTNTSQYSLLENWETIQYLDTGSITKNQISGIEKFLGNTDLPSRARRKVKHGDIVYSCVRPNLCHYGYIDNPPANLLVSTGFVVITVDPNLADARFIYYFLTQDNIVQSLHTIGEQAVSTYPSIKASDIEDLSISLPPLPIQHKIASILKSLDDKIEVNRRINDNLEQQAQALFKSWLSLCKDEVTIGDLSMNITDYTKCDQKQVVLINSSDVTEGYFMHHNLSKNENLKGHFKKRFTKGDILYSQVRPRNRHWGYCTFDAENYLASTQLMVIRNKKDIVPSILLYQYLIDDNVWMDFTLKTETRSGTFPQGNYEDLSSIKVPFGADINDISMKLKSLYTLLFNNEEESRRLAELRDTLLPRLMSGELSVDGLKGQFAVSPGRCPGSNEHVSNKTAL